MTAVTHNLLTEALLRADPVGDLTLPGVLAALTRDEIAGFPGLRPHQGPAWHMFLTQLAALALHRGGTSALPEEEDRWAAMLRALTPGFNADEPWSLVVEDSQKPAFLQPPVPDSDDVHLKNPVPSPDALDLLITARNHDVKQAIADLGRPQDWIFALVSLQTCEGYGGAGNHGIARMNSGYSSRVMLSLAPLPELDSKVVASSPGTRFRRDVTVMLESRDKELEAFNYQESAGLGLTWLESWPEDEQLELRNLDIWFIEVCRRIRLKHRDNRLVACKGTSKAARIDAKDQNGVLGDPFAPVGKLDKEKNPHSLTLSGRDFGYKLLTDLLLSGNWQLPVAARPGVGERDGQTLVLICEALDRGQGKTEGFKSRSLPLGGSIARAIGSNPEPLHTLACKQIEEIENFNKVLKDALALAAAGGDRDNDLRKYYKFAQPAQQRFDRCADDLFFDHLWERFAAQERADEAVSEACRKFQQKLFQSARDQFETALPAVPCARILRPRAEVRARQAFYGKVKKQFPGLFDKPKWEESDHGA